MRDNSFGCLCAFILGVMCAVTWYVEMFTDGRVATMWRRMNGKGRIGKNFAAVGSPALTCMCVIGVLTFVLDGYAPGWLMFGLACLMLLCLLVFLVGLLPIKFPRWVYAEWQYAKRHGLLDEKGNIDREAWERHAAERKDDPIW